MKRLYVGNLSYDMTEKELHAEFSKLGNLNSARLILDRDTGKSKGFAFVEYSNESDAQEALKLLNGIPLQGRQISVRIAEDRRSAPGRSSPAPRTPVVYEKAPQEDRPIRHGHSKNNSNNPFKGNRKRGGGGSRRRRDDDYEWG